MIPILILHGWGIGSSSWNQAKELLESKGHRVFVPELPGFGQTPPPPESWSVDDYVQWVKDYIDDLQTRGELQEPFFLVGHSFGGGMAVKFVNYFPEKIRGLILVAPKLRRQKTFRYYFGLFLAKIGKLIFSTQILSFLRPLARKVLYRLIGVGDWHRLELEKIDIMKETFKKIVGLDLTPFLSKIEVPTLIIWGKKDSITPIKDAYLANKDIKDSKLEIIENGRHALNLKMPEILAEKIIKFMGSH